MCYSNTEHWLALARSVDFALSYSNENSLSQCHHLSSVHHAKKVLPKFATPFRKQVWKHRSSIITLAAVSQELFDIQKT